MNIYIEDLILCHFKFPWIIKKHLITSIWIRRYLYILFLLILLISLPILQSQLKRYDDGKDRPHYCNQSMIRKHYMYNRSPQALFAQDPIRPSFTYELPNGNFCSSLDPPHALVFVISKSTNFGTRNAIRRTWGNLSHITSITKFAHLRLKLLFFIDIDETSLLSVNLEQSMYHDLVQVYLPEYYILSTYRDMAILDWTEAYCSKVLLTIKTDDDVFLNIFLLANVLNTMILNTTIHQTKSECQQATNFDQFAVIYGSKIHDAKVVRHSNDPKSAGARYITTDDEYPCRYYPDYMSGFGYIINRNARVKLLCAFFRHEKIFHMSDVYVTGILPEYLNIRQQGLHLTVGSRSTDDCDLFFNDDNAYACASSLHHRKEQSSLLTDVYVFERFHVYWKRVYNNRFLYTNQIRLFHWVMKN